ncbi:hypothetical protein HanIR_Chr10g0462031 [Helianthus annuus]|nr:hypothetical protein HanIR_Chr10g0462031 [Helianthus annuus]
MNKKRRDYFTIFKILNTRHNSFSLVIANHIPLATFADKCFRTFPFFIFPCI